MIRCGQGTRPACACTRFHQDCSDIVIVHELIETGSFGVDHHLERLQSNALFVATVEANRCPNPRVLSGPGWNRHLCAGSGAGDGAERAPFRSLGPSLGAHGQFALSLYREAATPEGISELAMPDTPREAPAEATIGVEGHALLPARAGPHYHLDVLTDLPGHS